MDGCTSVQVRVQVQVQAQGTPISSHPIPHHPISWSIAAQVTPSHSHTHTTHHTLSLANCISGLSLPSQQEAPYVPCYQQSFFALFPPLNFSLHLVTLFQGHEVELRSNSPSVCTTHYLPTYLTPYTLARLNRPVPPLQTSNSTLASSISALECYPLPLSPFLYEYTTERTTKALTLEPSSRSRSRRHRLAFPVLLFRFSLSRA